LEPPFHLRRRCHVSESVTWAILVGGAIVVGAVAVVVSAERQTNRNAAAAREAVATR